MEPGGGEEDDFGYGEDGADGADEEEDDVGAVRRPKRVSGGFGGKLDGVERDRRRVAYIETE